MTAFDSKYLEKASALAPGWMAARMRAALEVFESQHPPTGAEEDWRYVEFDTPLTELAPAESAGDPLGPGPFLSSIDSTSGHVMIVDGAVTEARSEVATVTRLAEMPDDPGLDRFLPTDHNQLAAAHAAFGTDGVLVDLPSNVVMTSPLVIEVQAVSEGTASFPAITIRVGENAEARVLVVYRSAEGARLLLVPEVNLEVADGGRLRFLSVQGLDHAANVVVHQRAVVGRDATVRIGEVGLGGNLGRLDLGVTLRGDGASSDVVGLYFGEGDQTLDYRMVVTHEGRNTSSDILLKGAVEGDAQSVFSGLLRIEKDAQGTSTFETNRNLVLSENAKAHSVPNLEILCDDVICGHGSSVGPLEEDHLYYLQSRGLGRERAERLLIRGFFQEVIERLPIEGVERPVADEVFSRFVAAQEEGRFG